MTDHDATERPQLRRSRQDRMLFGVAGGLGRYVGVDPVFVRIAFVALTLFGGSGVVLYLIGLIVIPEEKEGDHVGAAPASSGGRNVTAVVGIALVLIGAFALLRELTPGLDRFVGPLVLVLLGVVVLMLGSRR